MLTNINNLWQGDGASPIVLSMMFLLPGAHIYRSEVCVCLYTRTNTYIYVHANKNAFFFRSQHVACAT